MKIGIDCRLWHETGVGRYIRNLVLELSKIDAKNNYVLFALDKDVSNIEHEVSGNKNFKIVVANIRWHTLGEQLEFPQILNNENLDLVHFPYFSVPISYNRPFVITIHDLIVNHFPTGKVSTLPSPIYNLKRLAYKFVLNKSVKNAKKIIAVSNATKDEVINNMKINGNKIEVTHEGIDEKITNSKLQIPNKFKIQNKYFLYVGNAFPHKNLERLLKAFKILNSDANLVLVGKDDFFYKRIKAEIKNLDLEQKVIILEKVTDEELASLYQNALALIMPSLMEGFGLPVLEAMANSCPVVVSDIPSLREVCQDAAVYFNPYDTKDMIEKMSDIQTKDNNAMVKKGLERVRDFSWEKMAKKTLGIYESCFSLR